MQKCFNGLMVVNVELTSRCNKKCWMCGRRKIERDYPKSVDWGDMKFDLVEKIAEQLLPNIMVQLHNNGEPTLFPRLGEALDLFHRQIRHFDTNGKLIVEKADEIIGKLDTMTISLFRDDPEAEEQYELVKQFLDIRKNRKPMLIYRCLGEFDFERYKKLPGIIATRTLHSPMGSYKYEKRPTVPEAGICLDLLGHLVIDRYGKVSPCVRFDPKRMGVIGDANKSPLIDVWNGKERKKWLNAHIEGRRDKIPLCSYCEFWGVPTGY